MESQTKDVITPIDETNIKFSENKDTLESKGWEKFSRNLKSSLAVVITSGIGGYYQWQFEISKVLHPELEPGKFIGGIESFNSKEEFAEGAISSGETFYGKLLLSHTPSCSN